MADQPVLVESAYSDVTVSDIEGKQH